MDAQSVSARDLGYGADVAAMNADHDPLHRSLCRWLGVSSHSLREAAGEVMTPDDQRHAWREEGAVMAVQAFMRHHGVGVPG